MARQRERVRITYLEDDADHHRQFEETVQVCSYPAEIVGVELFADVFEHLPETDVLVMDAIGILGGFYNIDDRQLDAIFAHIREHYQGPIIVYSGLPDMIGENDGNTHLAVKGQHGFVNLLELIGNMEGMPHSLILTRVHRPRELRDRHRRFLRGPAPNGNGTLRPRAGCLPVPGALLPALDRCRGKPTEILWDKDENGFWPVPHCKRCLVQCADPMF